MLYLIFGSILLNLIFYFLLKEILKINLDKKYTDKYQKIKDEAENLERNFSLINRITEDITKTLESNIRLYQLTKQIYEFLEEDKVFSIFKDIISNFISFKECLFIKAPSLDTQLYKDDLVFELISNSEKYGFLVLKGDFSYEDREEFYILAQHFLLAIKRAKFYQRVQELSIVDSLTGLFNRRYFLERLKEEVERAEKLKLKFSFIMIDIDDFKKCNDSFGHLVGDYVLREVAKTIKDNTRHIDLVCRYGGEEFCVLFPNTGREGGYFASERIRSNLENKIIKAYDEELKVTVSIGLACFPEDGLSYTEIIEKSDLALYIAKAKGKNRVCVYKKMYG